MIKKLLVANRGEVAKRIFASCRNLGIKTVAVYSEADKDSPYTKEADKAICIGPPMPSKSYLNMEKIIDTAKEIRADAIHPGYGFLSENAIFANKVVQSRIIWVGPPPDVLAKIDSKLFCKQTCIKESVPVIPGSQGIIKDSDEIRECLYKLGPPLLIKLDKGGGGRGINRIIVEDDIDNVFKNAQKMGQAAFCDQSCYLEKELDYARHIEVQFLTDYYGNCIILGERECSIQRKYQKIIEESPSIIVSSNERKLLFEWTKKMVKAFGYKNAGTVEFLRSKEGNYYFMEINARLQVEHPVTEVVTGVDIVEEQLKIASGKNISFIQEDIKVSGHAIEARICAEDPETFIPSMGNIENIEFPVEQEHIRIDHNLSEGLKISPYYDSMLAKVIALGKDREDCVRNLYNSLNEFQITGIKTTIPLILKLLSHKKFVNNDINTQFLRENKL